MKEFRYLGPTILYKYMKYRDSFFDDPLLRFTPLDELNDPFELSLACVDFPDSTRNRLQATYPTPLGPNAERIVLAKCFGDVARKGNLNKDYGILSLTEDPENVLMWAHYAEEHKGMVVGIDLTHEFFKRMFVGGSEFALPVRYGNQRPLYSMATGSILASVEEFLATKGLQWGYEREWRVVTKDFSAKKNIRGLGGFINIPPESIKELFLGLRRTQGMIDKAQHFIAKNPQAKLFLGYKSVGAFGLDFLEEELAAKLFPQSLLASS